jgi:hypothetical protein
MKILAIGLAILSLISMGSSKTHTHSLVFSGQRYLSIVDNENRFDTVQERFNALCLVHERKSSDVKAEKVNNSWCVTVDGKVLVTVTNADSKLHKTSCEKLAKTWAKNVANNIESVTPLN